jgi:hypothetical protein
MFSRWGNKQAKTTLERDARDIKIACEQPLQHAHGVLEYRLKKGRNPKVIPTCFKTFIDSGTARTYVSTEPFAIFDCSSPGKSGDNTGQCSGTVDTPQNVHVSVEFSTTIEPSVQQVLQAITKVPELTREAFFEYGELQIDETFSFERIPELR